MVSASYCDNDTAKRARTSPGHRQEVTADFTDDFTDDLKADLTDSGWSRAASCAG